MPLNQKQHQYLEAMGINLWQRKNQVKNVDLHNQAAQNDATQSLDINVLSQSQLFNDILQAIDVSIGDISIDKNTLNLGWLNWEINKGNSLCLSDNLLRTPDIATLLASNTQKAELWAILAEQA